jgi:hypothetical protein
VAGHGDLDGDGLAEITVANIGEEFGDEQGGVYLLGSPQLPGVSGAMQSGLRFADRDPGRGNDFWLMSAHNAMIPLEDVSGDGLPELVLGLYLHQPTLDPRGNGTAYILDSLVPDATTNQIPLEPGYGWITTLDALEFAYNVAAGDVTGDGSQDLVVSSPKLQQEDLIVRGQLYVFQGPVQPVEVGPDAATHVVWADNEVEFDEDGNPIGDTGPLALGFQVVAGDHNADGVSDIFAFSFSYVNGVPAVGEVYVFDGPISSDVPTSAASAILQGDDTVSYYNFGLILSWLGDTNGDGYGDLGVGAAGGLSYFPIGHSFVFDGPLSGTEKALDRAATHFYGLQVGDVAWGIASAGDLDEDGLDDVAIGTAEIDGGQGGVLLYYGALAEGSFPVNDHPDATLWGEGWPLSVAAAGGDVDGDCMPDLIVGDGLADRVYLVQGGTL